MDRATSKLSTTPANIILAAISASGSLGVLALLFPSLVSLIAWILLSGFSGLLAYAGALRRDPNTARFLLSIAGLAVLAIIVVSALGLASPVVLVSHAVQGTANWFTLFAAFVVLAIGHFGFHQGRGSEFAAAVGVLVGLAFFQAQTGLHFVTFPLVCLALLAWYIRSPVKRPILVTFAGIIFILDMANIVRPMSMGHLYAIVGNGMTVVDTHITGYENATAHAGFNYWWNTRATVKRICNGPRMNNGKLSCMSIGPQADVPGSPPLVIVQAFKDQAPLTYEHEVWVGGYVQINRHSYDETQVVLMPKEDLTWALTNPTAPSAPPPSGKLPGGDQPPTTVSTGGVPSPGHLNLSVTEGPFAALTGTWNYIIRYSVSSNQDGAWLRVGEQIMDKNIKAADGVHVLNMPLQPATIVFARLCSNQECSEGSVYQFIRISTPPAPPTVMQGHQPDKHTLCGQSISGPIYKKWQELGGESNFGCPISDEYDAPGGRRAEFERGIIVWDSQTGTITVRAK